MIVNGCAEQSFVSYFHKVKKGTVEIYIHKELSIDIPCPFYGLMCSIKPCNEKKKGFI